MGGQVRRGRRPAGAATAFAPLEGRVGASGMPKAAAHVDASESSFCDASRECLRDRCFPRDHWPFAPARPTADPAATPLPLAKINGLRVPSRLREQSSKLFQHEEKRARETAPGYRGYACRRAVRQRGMCKKMANRSLSCRAGAIGSQRRFHLVFRTLFDRCTTAIGCGG
jgi:hypothetical protein